MTGKVTGIILATCNCLPPLPLSCGSISSTSSPLRLERSTRSPIDTTIGPRTYATHQDVSSREHRHVWPTAHHGQKLPTPYQIFSLRKGDRYSKARFHELVKLYHPDIGGSNGMNLSHSIQVERYRLIVAAHSILSDPVKRSAYDRFGAGWDGRAEVGGRASSGASPGPFTHSWSDPSDPIWRNATWEDWERFHARQAREHGTGDFPQKRAPVYMANSYFLALIIALAVLGSSINVGRAQDAGTYIVEQRDIVHDRAAKELRKVRQEASSMSSKEDRIEFFIRQRDATMGVAAGDVEALQDERAKRLLPNQEICASEDLRDKEI